MAVLITLLDNQQLRLRLHFDIELRFDVAESISPFQICAEPEMFFFFVSPPLFIYSTSFAYQRNRTCQISNIGLYDYKAFPSHAFYNKYTPSLSEGSAFQITGIFLLCQQPESSLNSLGIQIVAEYPV